MGRYEWRIASLGWWAVPATWDPARSPSCRLDEEDFREGLEEELSKELMESRWLTTLRLSSREEVEIFSLGRRPVGGRWRPPAGWNSCFK